MELERDSSYPLSFTRLMRGNHVNSIFRVYVVGFRFEVGNVVINIHVRRGRETELFRLGKLDKKGNDRLIWGQNPYYPERSVRFDARQQAVALQETFESAKKHYNIRPEVQTIDDCTDEELLTFRYSFFMGCLRYLDRESKEKASGNDGV